MAWLFLNAMRKTVRLENIFAVTSPNCTEVQLELSEPLEPQCASFCDQARDGLIR